MPKYLYIYFKQFLANAVVKLFLFKAIKRPLYIIYNANAKEKLDLTQY